MHTLPERIHDSLAIGGTITLIDGDEATTVPWTEIHEDAKAMAADLQARGVAPGSHVALLGPTSRRLVTGIEAVWLAGGTVVVMPLPMRMGSIDEFIDQTRRRLASADVSLLLIDHQLAPFIEPVPSDPPMVVLDQVVGDPTSFQAPKVSPSSLAILQFTSGSTSDPKGVALPHRTVCANLDAMAEAVDFDPRVDVLVSWLPLYHDMGLVGMLTVPMTMGCDLVLAGPQDFMAAPARWMQWLSTYRGTVTAGPNFAWVLATRSLRQSEETLDLSAVRIALNGAEPVDPSTVDKLVDAGERHGFRPGAVFPAFGMAETAIGATFPECGRGMRTDPVDLRVLETERYAAPSDPEAPGTRRMVKLGRPLPGLEIRIVDPESGHVRSEREVGELQIRGTSVTPGYYKHRAATEAAFDGDWLRTGDLAYLADGELVLCGRIKDVIIVAGRNVFPEDVERTVAEIEGVRAGNVIAFGVEGTRREGLVVVAEVKDADTSSVKSEVISRIRDSVGVRAKDVVLVPPGTLPKTSSGKLQRSLCRDRYLGRQYQPA